MGAAASRLEVSGGDGSQLARCGPQSRRGSFSAEGFGEQFLGNDPTGGCWD